MWIVECFKKLTLCGSVVYPTVTTDDVCMPNNVCVPTVSTRSPYIPCNVSANSRLSGHDFNSAQDGALAADDVTNADCCLLTSNVVSYTAPETVSLLDYIVEYRDNTGDACVQKPVDVSSMFGTDIIIKDVSFLDIDRVGPATHARSSLPALPPENGDICLNASLPLSTPVPTGDVGRFGVGAPFYCDIFPMYNIDWSEKFALIRDL